MLPHLRFNAVGTAELYDTSKACPMPDSG